MDETQMLDEEEEEEDENKENKPPPAGHHGPPSLFSYTNISSQILKFLPKSFNGKRKRTTESQDEAVSENEKKRKKPSLLSIISSAFDMKALQSTPKKDCKSPITDSSARSQYMIYMSQREPFDI